MSSHRPASGRHGPVFPLIGSLVQRIPGGWAHIRLVVVSVVLMVVVLAVFGVTRARRVAEFAPLSVIESREPLQELPIRAATNEGAVEPAHTYDAMLDLSNLDEIVVGIDLDYVTKGLSRYDVVIRRADGSERFRGRIEEAYFREGRAMLRLVAKRFAAGDYTLDIEGFDDGSAEGRIVASSWFQVLR